MPRIRRRRCHDDARATLWAPPHVAVLAKIAGFLMMTASWQHVAVLPVFPFVLGDDCIEASIGERHLTVAGVVFAPGPALDDEATLARRLCDLAATHPCIDVTVDDGVALGRVTALLDIAREAGFTSQSLHVVPDGDVGRD